MELVSSMQESTSWGSKSGTLVSGVSKLSKGTSALNAGVQELDKTLQAGPTNDQKTEIQSTAAKNVRDSFAGEQGEAVNTSIYNSLRYELDNEEKLLLMKMEIRKIVYCIQH